MFRLTVVAFAAVIALGAGAPTTAEAAAFGAGQFGHSDRGVPPAVVHGTSSFAPGLIGGARINSRIRIHCHGVQVGDPRKQPPMRVCP